MDYYRCWRNITMMSFWVFFASNIPVWILVKLVIQKQENCSLELKDRKGAIWKNGKLSTITTLLQPNTQEGKNKHKIFPFITHGGKILVGGLEYHSGEAVRSYPNPSAKAVSKEAEQRVGKLPPPLQMVTSPLPTTQSMTRDHMGRLNYYPHPPPMPAGVVSGETNRELGPSASASNNQGTPLPWCQWCHMRSSIGPPYLSQSEGSDAPEYFSCFILLKQTMFLKVQMQQLKEIPSVIGVLFLSLRVFHYFLKLNELPNYPLNKYTFVKDLLSQFLLPTIKEF